MTRMAGEVMAAAMEEEENRPGPISGAELRRRSKRGPTYYDQAGNTEVERVDRGYKLGDGSILLRDHAADGNPGDPRDPGDPSDPRDPGNPGDPGDPGDPSDPGDPGDTSDPSDPGDDEDIVREEINQKQRIIANQKVKQRINQITKNITNIDNSVRMNNNSTNSITGDGNRIDNSQSATQGDTTVNNKTNNSAVNNNSQTVNGYQYAMQPDNYNYSGQYAGW